MASIEVTPPARANSKKWTIQADGLWDECNPYSARDRKRCARALGTVTPEDILEAVREFNDRSQQPEPTPEPEPFVVVSGANEYTSESPIEALRDALEAGHPKGCRWKNPAHMCAVVLRGQLEHVSTIGRRVGADLGWSCPRGSMVLVWAKRSDIDAIQRASIGVFVSEIASHEGLGSLRFTTQVPPWGNGMHTANVESESVYFSYDDGTPEASSDDVGTILADLGWTIGGRYSHEQCPFDPSPSSSTRGPVVAKENYVTCYRCNKYRAWGAFDSSDTAPKANAHWLWDAAVHRAHWVHLEMVLDTVWPELLQKSYAGRELAREIVKGGLALAPTKDDEDPEEILGAVMNPSITWVRGEGGVWYHSQNMKRASPERQSGFGALPWTKKSQIRTVRIKGRGPLEGYPEIRPVSRCLRPELVPEGVILRQRRKPLVGKEREGMPSYQEALAMLHEDYPKLHEQYLLTLIGACACAEGGGPPIYLLVHGTSGAAKTRTATIAAEILGSEPADIGQHLAEPQQQWLRSIGVALSQDRRPLLINEVEKVPQLHKCLPSILGLTDTVYYRMLYENGHQSVKFTSPMVFTCINVPRILCKPELVRRFRGLSLDAKVPDWWGSPARWTESPTEDEEMCLFPLKKKRQAAEAIIEHGVQLARDCGFQWYKFSDAMGLIDPNDGLGVDADVIRGLHVDLYEHCRGNRGEVEYSESKRYPGDRGWVSLNSPAARKIMDELVPEVPSHVDARFICAGELKSYAWNDELGIDDPAIRCLCVTQGRHWLIKFTAGGFRGGSICNEALPPPKEPDVD